MSDADLANAVKEYNEIQKRILKEIKREYKLEHTPVIVYNVAPLTDTYWEVAVFVWNALQTSWSPTKLKVEIAKVMEAAL